MKVSLNWLRYLNDKYQCAAEPAPNGVDNLVEKIGAQLGAVEEVIDLGKKYEGSLAVKVVSCQKHPNADKLSVCLIDDGGVAKDVKRGKDNLVGVVCGAPNVKAGMLAVWLPPGKTVPSTYDKEPLVLEARDIRGVVSNGMLASAKELALGDDHTGIVEIDQKLKPGTSFAKAYRLDDFIVDIENKMFTHRPDLFGILGIAREIAGIQHHSFKSPSWYKEDSNISHSNGEKVKLNVKNELPDLVPRFCALVIKDIKVGQSPLFIKAKLASVGIKSINNIVDITNYTMMETAQPLHAYDYDKVKTGVLGIRLSKKGEQLKLIGGKTIGIQEGSMIVTDGKKPIGLGGIMGGSDTEVDNNTSTIILEVGNWNLNAIRKSAMTHGLFTDAATRFTKNQSPRQNSAVIFKATEDILKIAGGRVSGDIIDDKHFKEADKSVDVTHDFLNSRLGLELSTAEIKKLLENVEFKVAAKGNDLTVTIPFWRTDIEIPEDIVEEVGRLYGYDHLPRELPKRDLEPTSRNKKIDLQQRVRDILSAGGANEVLTYTFVHGNLLKAVGQEPNLAFKLANALSPDVQYYRLSITPSLLAKVHQNLKAGGREFLIYEIGKVYSKVEKDEEQLPKEFGRVAAVFAADDKMSRDYAGSPYYEARKYLSYLFERFSLTVRYLPFDAEVLKGHELLEQMTQPFNESRSAFIFEGDRILGIVGEYKEDTSRALKLPAFCSGFEIFLSSFNRTQDKFYEPINKFPALDQDITFRAEASYNYKDINDFLDGELASLSKKYGYKYLLMPIDIFQKAKDKNYKQITWRITLEHPDRTLTTKEANDILDKLTKSAARGVKAERI